MQNLLNGGALKLGTGQSKDQPHLYQKPLPGKQPEKKPAAPELKEVKTPYADCAPKPATLEELTAIKPDILGHTGATWSPGHIDLSFEDGFCKAKVGSEPKLSLVNFMYVKEGTYSLGKEAGDGRCHGKTVNANLHITPEMASRVRQGEIEHCNDVHRAFNLSVQSAMQVFHLLEKPGVYLGRPEHCQEVILGVVKDTVGVAPSELDKAFACLVLTSKSRDDKHWHTVDQGKPVYDKGCKTATYTPDATTALPELGKHSSEEIVNGCKVKS